MSMHATSGWGWPIVNAAQHYAAQLDRYIHHHTAMEGLVLALENPHLEWRDDPAHGRMAEASFTDAFGVERDLVILARPAADAKQCFEVVLSERGNAQDQTFAHERTWEAKPRAVIGREGEHFTLQQERPAGNQPPAPLPYCLRSDALMRDIQMRALDHYRANMERVAGGGLAVIATGTGKSFAIGHALNANGAEGVIVTANATLAQQLADDCKKCGIAESRLRSGAAADALLKTPEAIGDRSNHPVLILTFDQLPKFLPHLHGQLVCIDEPHELERREDGLAMLERLCDQNPNFFALTATPTEELTQRLGASIYECNLYKAVKEKRFRGLHVRTDQISAHPQDQAKLGEWPKGAQSWNVRHAHENAMNRKAEPEFIYKALLGYFGSDEYIAPHERGYTAPSADHAPVQAVARNRVRFAGRKNIAFTVQPELAENLARAYQQLFDEGRVTVGGKDTTDMLCAQVTQARNDAAIAALQTMQERMHQPIDADTARARCEAAGLLSNPLSGADLQREAQEALKQQLCNSINREYLAYALGNTPGMTRQALLQNHLPLSDRQRLDSLRDTGKLEHDFTFEIERRGGSRELARQLWLKVKDRELLALRPEDIDLTDFPEARYTQTITNHTAAPDQRMMAMKQQLDRGLVVHTINNHQFESGLNDPDIYMTQRLIENVGPYVVRATQIAGRPLRANDGIALVQDIVGPTLKTNGTPGKDSPFLTGRDVFASDYASRACDFEAEFARAHAANPRYKPAAAQGLERMPVPISARTV